MMLQKKTPEEITAEKNASALRLAAFFRRVFFCALGGICYALALPPCNLFALALSALLPLAAVAVECRRPARAFFYGWVWGACWALCSCWFLREIEYCVPFLIAPVLGCWSGVWAACQRFLWRNLFYPPQLDFSGHAERLAYRQHPSFWRMSAFVLVSTALFTLLEWTRSRLFVWNDFSVTQWQNRPLIQLAAWTGSYGVGFLTALPGVALLMSRYRRGWRVALVAFVLFGLVEIWGIIRIITPETTEDKQTEFQPALIQGDLSQRRHATLSQTAEALDIYFSLSELAAQRRPQLIIWPESAIPIPLRSSHPDAENFRQRLQDFLRSARTPMLIGALDFLKIFADGNYSFGVTNSALLIDSTGEVRGKYDKVIRVPFGEYIPFRRFLPEALIQYIDMGRDLTPGRSFEPLAAAPGVRAGMAICYEGVFAWLTRRLAQHGANVLIVLSNDAWYPKSSEPEQHLANAVMRAVETGLPMIRCGNNGGSGVVTPKGEFTQSLLTSPETRPELLRGRSTGTVHVKVSEFPRPTFYVRHGEWFIGVLAGIAGAGTLAALLRLRRRKLHLASLILPGKKDLSVS